MEAIYIIKVDAFNSESKRISSHHYYFKSKNLQTEVYNRLLLKAKEYAKDEQQFFEEGTDKSFRFNNSYCQVRIQKYINYVCTANKEISDIENSIVLF